MKGEEGRKRMIKELEERRRINKGEKKGGRKE